MTWCSKIYDMFNGWNDEENVLSSIKDTNTIEQIHSDYYQNDIDEDNSTIIQHDSPFLEKSDSLINGNLYNNDYLNNPNYHKEEINDHSYASYHQPIKENYYNPEQGPYSIATISNMSLNLPKYLRNTDQHFQEKLSRSYLSDLPMDLKRDLSSLPVFENISPHVRYSINSQFNEQLVNGDRPNRLSLNLNQSPIENQQESFGHRVSTRSLRSTIDYENNETQSRNNEQIEQTVQHYVKEMLTSSPGGVFPMIYSLPENETLNLNDQYRIEGGYGEPSQWMYKTKIAHEDCRLVSDNVATIYSNYFYDQYHHNLYGIDDFFNPIVMSLKPRDERLTVILRTKDGSKCVDFIENSINMTDYINLSKQIYPNLQIDHFENCVNYRSQEFIKTFDEKFDTQKFKFGIIYQRKGQTTEEEFFNNQTHDRTFDEFLGIIAQQVSLKNFKNYRGGLDASEQTDSPISYYECYEGKEIMFHVSTLLPYSQNDKTQIQRKRHIGNDIVAIVFQEENTPFHPSMIKSNFLHIFLVVQPVQILSKTCYKIMLVARDDIEEFPPLLQRNIVYVRTAENLKSFILTKLINGEYAAYRCQTFCLLQERTRCSFLKTLGEHLFEKSYETLCDELKRPNNRRLSLLSNSTRKRYLSTMKKMFTKSNSASDGSRQSIKSDQVKIKPNKKLISLGKSMDSVEDYHRPSINDSLPDNESSDRRMSRRSDDSLTSSVDLASSTLQQYSSHPGQVYYGDESDEGLDSMSSADTARLPYDSDDQDTYRQQILDKSQPSHLWYRASNPRQILIPRSTGIHISEETTV